MTDLTPQEREEQVLRFIKNHQTAVLGTIAPDGKPHGATVTYACDDEFTFYFVTRKNSRKARNLAENPQVSLVVGVDPSETATVQAQGSAHHVEDGLLGPFAQIVDAVSASWPPLRRSGMDFAFYKIAVSNLKWSEFGDSGEAGDHNASFTIIPRTDAGEQAEASDAEPLENYD